MKKLNKEEKSNLKIAIDQIDSLCLFHRMVYESNRSFLVLIPSDQNFETMYNKIFDLLGCALYQFTAHCTVGGNYIAIEVKSF